MLFKNIIVTYLLLSSLVFAEDDLSQLLNIYENESELSKITKQESAGFIDVYTKEELKKMQAHNLLDVLKTLPSLYLTRGANNTTLLAKPTVSKVSLTSVRLYINDHDMSSSSFGSAFLIWGEMPIEYIDHIEVYKATSSIEFGNETSALVIRLYTKTAEREEGGKIRTVFDQKGSSDLNAYIAKNMQNGLSYFAYANIDNVKRDIYHNSYEDKTYQLKSDKNGYNLYANLSYNKWNLELGNYHKKSDSFIGLGVKKTPGDGDLEAKHSYIHLSKTFENSIKLQLSYDDMLYDRVYQDENGLKVANIENTLDNYNIIFNDKILSFILEKKIEFGSNSLLIGSFYKNKGFSENGEFKNSRLNYEYKNNFSNSLNLYSLYLEDSYDFDETTKFILSLKSDFFRYAKDVKSQDEFVARTGVIKNIDKFQMKLFYIKTYIPLAFYQTYNQQNIPYKSNPNLNAPKLDIATASLRYRNKNHEAQIIVAANKLVDGLVYKTQLANGYINSSSEVEFMRYQLKYSYQFDFQNKIYVDIFKGKNNKEVENSPKYGVNLRLFNQYKKFDFYNELIFRDAYEYIGVNMSKSYDYTAAVKYNISDDLSFGIRGENIFDAAYRQAYRGLDFSIPVTDRKFWLNMEYLF